MRNTERCSYCGGYYGVDKNGKMEEHARHHYDHSELPTMDCAKKVEVLITTILRRGSGDSTGDPIRIITQCWSMSGKLLFEDDPCRSACPGRKEKK